MTSMFVYVFFSSRRRHTRCALVTGVQTCALPISTVDVAANSAFDEARLAAYLAGRIADFSGPMRVQRFEGGQSNPTFLLSTQDQSYVLRRKPAGILLKSAHEIGRATGRERVCQYG